MSLSLKDCEELILATHNAGKVREIREMLAPHVPNIIGAADIDLPEPEETENTFEGNALLKARAAAAFSGKPALADDSGLSVDALGGRPGVYSARYVINPETGERDFAYGMQKLHDELGDESNRKARYVCVLALAHPDGRERTFRGEVEGTLIWPPRGTNGFGYDPVFEYAGGRTFAEMSAEEKKAVSHRNNAFRLLMSG